MGHLIEEYAKSLGVKIGKPVMAAHFYPTLHEKYITIHTDDKIDSKNYEYFPMVLNLLIPFLKSEGYKIYQVGGAQDPVLANVDGSFLNLNFKQSAYVIKNSRLHIGIDSLPVHIASMYDVPIVVLYSHIFASNAYPYWSTKEKVVIIEADRGDLKPSFAYKESPKTIRSIDPEDIAAAALKLLGINKAINFKTLYIGSHYHIPFTEIVPNFTATLNDQKDKTLYIRADLSFDAQIVAYWCSEYKTRIITDKVIPLDLVQAFAAKIDHIFFKLESSEIPVVYFEGLRSTKVAFSICVSNKEGLAKIRNDYFDFKVEYDDYRERLSKQEKFKGKFFTNRMLLSKGKMYPSEAHFQLDKPIDTVNEVIYDSDEFWKDAEHFYFYTNESRQTT